MNTRFYLHKVLSSALVAGAIAACSGGEISTLPPPDVSDFVDVPEVMSPSSDQGVEVLVAMDAGDSGNADTAEAPRDSMVSCMADGDCGASTPVCDTASRRCVQCLAARDACPASRHCVDATHTCEPGCRSDEGCGPSVDAGTARATRCEPGSHACVECLADSHCTAGSVCVGNVCTMGCNATQPCSAGQSCCSGACVDALSNVAHCGRCDNRCAAPNASVACMNGACTLGVCTVPYGDCDRSVANGCEVNTFTDGSHCGGCAMACGARPNASASCAAGRCEHRCTMGFDECDGNPVNGCETNLMADPTRCGSCSNVCAPPNALPACVMGRCAILSCTAGFGDCDMNATNGCETDLRNSVAHCGTCGNSCPSRPNAFPGCLAGGCVTSCVTGFSDCDGDGSNGCEVNLRTNASHCGSCGRVCRVANASAACEAAQCRVASCSAGYSDCDRISETGCEIDLTTDPFNCALCGNRCAVGANQSPTCRALACGTVCNAGFVDLDRNPLTGCECNSSDPDDPDLSFRDTNCDGIDGTARLAVFVSPRGSDGNPGTMSLPRRTLQSAIALAASSSPRRSVYAARGVYLESVSLASGVSVYGGYDDTAGWSRALNAASTVQGGTTAVTAQDVVSALELQLLTLVASDASSPGGSTYGLRSVNSPALITLRACDITAGRAASGSDGASGSNGSGGANGSNAGTPTAGGGGFAPCGPHGGTGGSGVSGTRSGIFGGDGTAIFGGASAGGGGSGGLAGARCCLPGNGQSAPGNNSPGMAGGNGGNGGLGAPFGALRTDNGLYEISAGGNGSDGRSGGGGGAGGSGGGGASGCPFSCGDDTSGGGGGGGAGGCGGRAGRGGGGGGGSFAVVALGSNLRIEDSQLRTRDGGRGGNGGNGGLGGNGGGGGSGGRGSGVAGNGAAGQSGGSGGAAGSGAGGSGGPSVCVLFSGTSPSVRGGTCTLGSPGAGGLGGSSSVLGAAPAGALGVSVSQRSAP